MNYMKITKHDIANGEGIRVVLWCSGCTLHCKECQNPQTWDFNAGKPFDDVAKQELFDALDHPWIQGLTLSGGHPLEKENIECMLSLIREWQLANQSVKRSTESIMATVRIVGAKSPTRICR